MVSHFITSLVRRWGGWRTGSITLSPVRERDGRLRAWGEASSPSEGLEGWIMAGAAPWIPPSCEEEGAVQ